MTYFHFYDNIITSKGCFTALEVYNKFQSGESIYIPGDNGVSLISDVSDLAGVFYDIVFDSGEAVKLYSGNKVYVLNSKLGLDLRGVSLLKAGDIVSFSMKDIFLNSVNLFDVYYCYVVGFITSVDVGFKNIPYFIFKEGKDSVEYFLSGIYESCGYVDGDFIEFILNYEGYARDLGYLLSLFGVNYSIRFLGGKWRVSLKDRRSLKKFINLIKGKSFWDIKKSKLDKFIDASDLADIKLISEQLRIYLERVFSGISLDIEFEKLINLYLEVLNKSEALTYLSESDLEYYFNILVLRHDIFLYLIKNEVVFKRVSNVSECGGMDGYGFEVGGAFINNGLIIK